MKYKISLWLILLLIFSNNLIYAAERCFDAKVAVVDAQLVFDNAIAINNIKEALDKINDSIQHDISSKEMELKAREATLVKKKDNIGEEEFNKETDKFNKEVSQIQQTIQTKKARLEQIHNDAFAKVYDAMKEIITQISQKYHINLVISNSHVLLGDPSLNITEEVITLLNQKLTKVDIKF